MTATSVVSDGKRPRPPIWGKRARISKSLGRDGIRGTLHNYLEKSNPIKMCSCE